jgi:DNA invertase Pin-like site-specific DNA recombinase
MLEAALEENKKRMTTAAIYCRVSTEEQDADKQEAACVEYCQRQGITIFKVYKDICSGGKTSRPNFDVMITDMRQFKFDCIMVTKLDRIGRSLQHILSLFAELNSKGVKFVSVTQNIDTTTSAGTLQMQVMAAFAEFERNIISERTKEGLKGNTKVGKRGKDKKPRQKRGGLRKGGSIWGNLQHNRSS